MRIKKSYFLIKTRNLQILDPQKLLKHGASQSIYMFHTKPKQLPSKLSNLASVIVWFQSKVELFFIKFHQCTPLLFLISQCPLLLFLISQCPPLLTTTKKYICRSTYKLNFKGKYNKATT
jgi:hypothetical protein